MPERRARSQTEIAATNQALKLVGLKTIAKACKRWPSAVHHWKIAGVPAEFVLQLEKLTQKAGKKIPKEKIRPDLYKAAKQQEEPA